MQRGRPPRDSEVCTRERLPLGRGETCANAAHGGHLEVLKWARENDCPWDGRTCAFAANGGHLELLARENGCPWDEKTGAYAARAATSTC